MTEEKINRINELYHKKQAGTLTAEEAIEQQTLRREYLDDIRGALRGQLNNISVVEKDGSITDLGAKYGSKNDPS